MDNLHSQLLVHHRQTIDTKTRKVDWPDDQIDSQCSSLAPQGGAHSITPNRDFHVVSIRFPSGFPEVSMIFQ